MSDLREKPPEFAPGNPVATAPWGEIVWVKNLQMISPCLATRGYVYNGMVHPDHTFFPSVYTPDPQGFPIGFPGGALVVPTHWMPRANGGEK